MIYWKVLKCTYVLTSGADVVVTIWSHDAYSGAGGPAIPSHPITLSENKVQKCWSVWKNAHPGYSWHKAYYK